VYPRPVALQWGGQVFLGGERQSSSYALATLLSTVRNRLDVTLLRDWGYGATGVLGCGWGISRKSMAGLSKRDFVPLSDISDIVWKVGPFKRGGMNSPEHANHFAS
jgi:hypothetical protein